MELLLERPGETISRFVCVRQQPDKNIIVWVSENHRGDFQVQNYVSRLQKQNPQQVVVKFSSLDEITALNDEQGTKLLDCNSNQLKVLGYFRRAVAVGASDLHFSIGRDGSQFCYIEMRVHGELSLLDCIDKDEGMTLAGTVFQGMCDITETQFDQNRQQDARVSEKFLKPLGIFGARYAHTPAVGGVYAVMRLITDDGLHVPTFAELGYLPEQVTVLKKILRRPEGMVILSGPTGSGKSTTLRSASSFYLEETGYNGKLPRKRLQTIEDPPEGRIPGAIQTPIIADKTDILAESQAWLKAIKYALRLDPDAILTGEIRDLNSAMAAIKAAMTGHILLTTLHANDPLNIAERLEIEGVPGRLIADPQLFIGLMSQRLVQKLCPDCKHPWESAKDALSQDDQEMVEKYCDTSAVALRNMVGCKNCYQGIVGRVAVAEVIAPDAQFFALYRTEGKSAAKTYWHRSLGGITRNQHVLHYINAGEVDPISANLICPLDEDEYTLLREA